MVFGQKVEQKNPITVIVVIGFLVCPKRNKKVGLDCGGFNLLEKRHGETNKERREEVQLHTQEGQDFSETTTTDHLITHKSSESRSVDLTNVVMVNHYVIHYLRDVEHGSLS